MRSILGKASRAVVLAVGLVGLSAAGAPAGAGALGWHSWAGEPTGVFRSGTYSRGEWIYTNGIHQALGANTDGLHRTDYYRAFTVAPTDPGHMTQDVYNALTYDAFGAHRSTHNGDYQLPQNASAWPEGTADLAELRLAVEGGYLYVRWQWNSMPRPDAQIATLTFSGPGGPATASPWPRSARLSSPWERALTVWGTGGTLARAGGGETAVAARTGDHVTEARVALSQLPPGPWTLGGGAGLDDPAAPGRYWSVAPGDASAQAPGSGGPTSPTNVWDLLFAADHPWTFDERHQADELDSGLDSDFQAVDPSALSAAQSNAPPVITGDLTRQFSSRLLIADGIDKQIGLSSAQVPAELRPGVEHGGPVETWKYTGRESYYGMHVPQRYPGSRGAWPLIIYLHGYTGVIDEGFYNPTGLVAAADREGYLFATPMGRGDYFYTGEGDLDVLEALADVERHYRVDPRRIYIMGHSMGGYGSGDVATHHPDLFAAGAPAEGTGSAELYANLRNVPWLQIGAHEDLDPAAKDALAEYHSLSAAGYDAQALVYHTKIHEYSSIYDTLPRIFAHFGAHRLNPDPPTVTWTRETSQDRPDLGLVYDGAYWLRGVRAADPSQLGTVTATSDEIPHPADSPASATRVEGQQIDAGGPSGRTTADYYRTAPASAGPVAPANVLRVQAVNVAAVSVDAARTRLTVRSHPLHILTADDQPLAVTLNALGTGPVTERLDGRPVGRLVIIGGRLLVAAPPGRHEIVLAAVPGPRGAGCSRTATAHFRIHQDNGRVRRVDVYLGVRRLRSVQGRRITRLTLRLPRRGTFVLRIVDSTVTGRQVTTVRRYHNCHKGPPRTSVRRSA